MSSVDVCEEWAGPADEILNRISQAGKCRALFQIWDDMRNGSRQPPAKSALDPVRLAKAGLLPYVWVVECDDAGNCFYRLSGEVIRNYFSAPIKGRYLNEVYEGHVLALIKARYDRILGDNLVEFSSGDVFAGGVPIYYARRLLLPLSDEAGRTRYLIGTVDRMHYEAANRGEQDTPRYTYDFIGYLPLSDLDEGGVGAASAPIRATE